VDVGAVGSLPFLTVAKIQLVIPQVDQLGLGTQLCRAGEGNVQGGPGETARSEAAANANHLNFFPGRFKFVSGNFFHHVSLLLNYGGENLTDKLAFVKWGIASNGKSHRIVITWLEFMGSAS
jgi:hypothetical protein